MSANFDNSAWFYDRLSRLIYGRKLIDAQVWLLQFIPAGSRILIIGGGTGWILEEITKIYLSGLQITYIDVAAKMVSRAKRRNTGGNKVSFINDAIENVALSQEYDVIITPFLFDNFTEETLNRVFIHVHSLIKPEGTWLNASFQSTGKLWQRILLKSMFLFFKVLCGIEASQLPAISACFEKHGYQVLTQRTFFKDFIVSRVYSRI